MTDKTILAAPGESAEDSETRLGLTVYGDAAGNIQTVLSYTGTGQVAPGLAWLTGNFTGTDNGGVEHIGLEIAQPWDNDGALGLNIYANIAGALQPVFVSGDMGQGSSALAWLTGNFTGTGNDFTEIAQPWDDNGTLGLIVYGSPGGTPEVVFANPDMGQGSSAVAWLTGDFTGSGTTQIAQLWNNNGTLGLIVYGNAGNGTLETVFANPDMGQGSSAVAWLTGFFTGSGTTTQIAQLWNDNGALGLIVYGNAGNGTVGTVFANPDMGEGSGGLAFLAGNFTGSGPTQIAQPWDDNGTLQLLVYADTGNGSLQVVFSKAIGQIPEAQAFLTGDFTGSGNSQIAEASISVLA